MANRSNPEACPANPRFDVAPSYNSNASSLEGNFCVYSIEDKRMKLALDLVSPMLKRQGKELKNPTAIHVRGNKAPMHPCIGVSHS